MKRILVTGGSRGLGLAICRRLLDEGHTVLTASRKPSRALARLQSEHAGRIQHYRADFADPEAVLELVRSARLLEGVDGFVANTAIGTEGLLILTSDQALRECVEVNLIATMRLAREVIKGMLNHGGSVVFISSVAAQRGFSGLSVYSATKGALISFAHALAREYGTRGIRVNCVLPGFLQTAMNRNLAAAQRERIVRRTPAGRLGRPEDVANWVCYLLSDQARFVTGAEMVVDGGLTA